MADIFDINVSFSKNFVNNSVASVSDKRAVQQFVVDLLNTNTMEIPFKEWEGAGLSTLLGEACSNINASIIVEQIRLLLEKYNPYIEIQDIQYLLDPDNQRYVITLYYTLVNATDIIEQTLYLTTEI